MSDSDDSTEPYTFNPSNAADVVIFANTVRALSNHDGTMLLDDNQTPDASAPTVTINDIPDGNEGTGVILSAVLAGGTYDTVTYAWSVGRRHPEQRHGRDSNLDSAKRQC